MCTKGTAKWCNLGFSSQGIKSSRARPLVVLCDGLGLVAQHPEVHWSKEVPYIHWWPGWSLDGDVVHDYVVAASHIFTSEEAAIIKVEAVNNEALNPG